MATKFTDWKHNADYNDLDKSGGYQYAAGVIPVGVTVKFKADGTKGTVIHSNTERCLVSYRPSPLTGCTEARDWFYNSELRVPAA